MNSTYLVDIQRFCLDDGPGIRSTVFIKGCPLRCRWCSNPECQKTGPELSFYKGRCLGWQVCGLCLARCPQGHIQLTHSGAVRVDHRRCDACGLCAEVCPVGALSILGRSMSLTDIFSDLENDRAYYDASGGGVTLSGGEPLTRQHFTAAFTQEAKQRKLHCVIQTSGYFDLDDLAVRASLTCIDRLDFEVRQLDSSKHKLFTGVDNGRILENLRRLGEEFPHLPIAIRTLIVPGFNDKDSEIADICRLLAHHPTVREYRLLPCHTLGQGKYIQLGREIPLPNPQRIPPSRMAHLESLCVAMCIPSFSMTGEKAHAM